MISRTTAETVIYRTAVAAIFHYPDRDVSEPGYTVDEAAGHALGALPDELRGAFRGLIQATITDPTAHRAELIFQLMNLVPHEGSSGFPSAEV